MKIFLTLALTFLFSNNLNLPMVQAIPPVQATTAAIVNSADFSPVNHIAARQHSSIFGSNLTLSGSNATAPNDTTKELNGTTVFLVYQQVRIQCILSYVSAGQINIVTPDYSEGLPFSVALPVSFEIYYRGTLTARVPSAFLRDVLGIFFVVALSNEVDADGVSVKVPNATVEYYDATTGMYLGNQLLFQNVNGQVVRRAIVYRPNVIQFLVLYGGGFLANPTALQGARLVTGGANSSNIVELPTEYLGPTCCNLGQANIRLTDAQGNLLVPVGSHYSYMRFGGGSLSNYFFLQFE